MITIYHNPRCKKSRAGLEYLTSKTSDFQVKQYLKEEDAFNEESLTQILTLLRMKPLDMIRKQEAFYKKEMKGNDYSDEELIALMVENPKLINRPIVIKDKQAVWGDPAENIEKLF